MVEISGPNPWYNEWQYNGVASFADIIEWCEATLAYDDWNYRGWETIEFYDEATWVMFQLRWA